MAIPNHNGTSNINATYLTVLHDIRCRVRTFTFWFTVTFAWMRILSLTSLYYSPHACFSATVTHQNNTHECVKLSQCIPICRRVAV